MAKGEYHLGKNGPAPCGADPSKPNGRACRYESAGHFPTMEAAEAGYAKTRSTVPEAVSKAASTAVAEIPRPLEESYAPAELQAMREYRNGANWTINGNLRDGQRFSARAAEAVATIDGLIERSEPLKSPALVLRSLDTGAGSEYGIPNSGVYSDPAFLSCSTSSDYIESTLEHGVDDYSDNPSDTILAIELPAGSRVLAFSLEDQDYAEEAEVLLPRGSELEILEDSGFVQGVRRLRARLIVED